MWVVPKQVREEEESPHWKWLDNAGLVTMGPVFSPKKILEDESLSLNFILRYTLIRGGCNRCTSL